MEHPSMAKRKTTRSTKPPPPLLPEDDEDRGPTFDLDSVTCLGATLYNVREAVEETAIKRAKGTNPVPLNAMKVALLEHGLGWALQDPNDEDPDP
jgi:hypothetical protein